MKRERSALVGAFAAGLRGDDRKDLSAVDAEALGAVIESAVRVARAAWPELTLDEESFAQRLGEVMDGASADLTSELAKVQAPDLYLAHACLAGDEGAHRSIARLHFARVREWVAHVDRSAAFADDVRQEAYRRLLVGDDAPGKLVEYTGRGALGAFIRVFATRLARKMKRRKAEAGGHDEPSEMLQAPDLDPEVALLRRRYAKEFSDAFRAVLATLEPDERNVLKLHYIDGLSIEEVGTAYRVSRATAARWLAKAKQRVTDETQRALAERLGASAPGAASLFGLVRSQLDASLMNYLRK